jgi:glycosyltransferase involved in cell wall biosynthesis
VARFLRKAVIVDYRLPGPEALIERGGLIDNTYQAYLRGEHQLLARADLVLCPSPAIEQLLATRSGLPREKLVLLRDGPGTEGAREAPSNGNWRRGRKHLAVYVGPLTRYAGVDLFVRAARRIVYGLDIAHVQFVIAGEGLHRRAIEDLIVAEGLKDFVSVTASVNPAQRAELLAAADVAIDPLPASPLGRLLPANVLADYVARGTPAVAFDRGVSQDQPGGAVRLIKGTDIPGLADAIMRTIETKPATLAPPASATHWRGDAGPVYASLIQRILAIHAPAPHQGSVAPV